jgi:hypothetical protein
MTDTPSSSPASAENTAPKTARLMSLDALRGFDIPLSIQKRRAAGAIKRSLYLHAARRAVILFILGMVTICFHRVYAW